MVLIGLVTAAVFGLLAWRVPQWPDLLGYSLFAVFGLAVSVIDIAEHRIPTRLVLPAYPAVVGLFGATAALQRDFDSLARAAIGSLVLPAFYLILALASQGGMGAGDVRLAGPMGWVMAWHGWTTLVAGAVLAFLIGSIVILIRVISRSAARHTPQIPFGPAMVAAALTTIVL